MPTDRRRELFEDAIARLAQLGHPGVRPADIGRIYASEVQGAPVHGQGDPVGRLVDAYLAKQSQRIRPTDGSADWLHPGWWSTFHPMRGLGLVEVRFEIGDRDEPLQGTVSGEIAPALVAALSAALMVEELPDLAVTIGPAEDDHGSLEPFAEALAVLVRTLAPRQADRPLNDSTVRRLTRNLTQLDTAALLDVLGLPGVGQFRQALTTDDGAEWSYPTLWVEASPESIRRRAASVGLYFRADDAGGWEGDVLPRAFEVLGYEIAYRVAALASFPGDPGDGPCEILIRFLVEDDSIDADAYQLLDLDGSL